MSRLDVFSVCGNIAKTKIVTFPAKTKQKISEIEICFFTLRLIIWYLFGHTVLFWNVAHAATCFSENYSMFSFAILDHCILGGGIIYYEFVGVNILRIVFKKLTKINYRIIWLKSNINLQCCHRALNNSLIFFCVTLTPFVLYTIKVEIDKFFDLPVFAIRIIKFCLDVFYMLWFLITMTMYSVLTKLIAKQFEILTRIPDKCCFYFLSGCADLFQSAVLLDQTFGINILSAVIFSFGTIILGIFRTFQSKTECIGPNNIFIILLGIVIICIITRMGLRAVKTVSKNYILKLEKFTIQMS